MGRRGLYLRQCQELAGGYGIQGASTLHHLYAGSGCDVQKVVTQGNLYTLQQDLRSLSQEPLGQHKLLLWTVQSSR